jgi:hypothetical protein
MDAQVLVCSRLGKSLRRLAIDILHIKDVESFSAVVGDLGEPLSALSAVCLCGGIPTAIQQHHTHPVVQPFAEIVRICVKAVTDTGRTAGKVWQAFSSFDCERLAVGV